MADVAHRRYPVEELAEDEDDGTMEVNVAELTDAVVGHRIVRIEKDVYLPGALPDGRSPTASIAIVLDNGKRVALVETSDCCAYTHLDGFFLRPDLVDHVIIGVGTTEGYSRWHIYADLGDILELEVGWSCGNPFYYGYGFDILVYDPPRLGIIEPFQIEAKNG